MNRPVFALSVRCDPAEPRQPAALLADWESGEVTWVDWAANLLKASDMSELSVTQDEGGPEGSPDAIEEAWADFLPTQELDPEKTGYYEVSLGTLYGVPCVRFYDTGYSGFVFREADVAGRRP